MTKKEERRIVRERIAALGREERALFDRAIAERLITSKEYREARTLFLYYPMRDEADTTAILSHALEQGKEVFLPRIEGEEMALVPYREGDVLRENEYGILEPTREGVTTSPDLAVIPLRAFDRERRRLGRGKGFYDRFLASFRGTSLAVAYSVQETERVPTEPFDRRPDAIITEKERVE